MKNKIFISLLLLATYFVNAQVFPVQINSNINRPYLPSVSSYATVPAQNYLVNIITADLSVVNRAAKLKIYIEGNGIIASSNPVVIGAQPILLNGGETLNLTNTELAPYFELQNLSGINPLQYSNNFAQGTYNFCVEVYDANTNQKISQKTCTPFYFLYNEPPFLNIPVNNGVVQFQDPTNILFTWTPRHINATNIEYKFRLIEVPQGLDPNIVILAPNPLYEFTTNNTVLNYDMGLPQLIEGKKYAWRVQAIQAQGFGEFSVFNNNGYSQVYSFDYPGPCEPPLNVLSSSLSATSCQLTWATTPKHIDFVVQYRKQGTTEWFNSSHNNNTAVIHGLEAGATYEFQVGGKCIGDTTIFSQINTFTQPNQNQVALNCGIAPTINLTNVALYTANLASNDAFIAGDFTIRVLSSAVAGDVHTGEGYIKVPYLGFAKIAVEYKDIKLNTDKKLVDGVVKFKYDPTWSNVLDLNDLYDTLEDQLDMLSPDVEENITTVNYVASTVTVLNGQIIVTGPDGQITNINQDPKEINVITDANGNVWGVPAGSSAPQLLQQGSGFIANSVNTNGIGTNGQVTGITAPNGFKVTFEKVSDATFGDDILKSGNSDKIKAKYKTIKDQNNTDYPVFYKYVIGSGEIPDTRYAPAKDKIKATVIGSVDKSKIIFNIHGVRVGKDVAFDGNSIILEVPVFDTSSESELVAIYDPTGKTTANQATTANGTGANTNNATTTTGDKPSVLGVAKIIAGKLSKDIKVEIIPINGAIVPSVQEAKAALDAIYKPVGVNFTVTIAPNFNSTKTTLDFGEDYILENYTPGMRDFKNEYTKTHTFDKDKYYLFAMKNVVPSKAVDGFMPLHRQYGFIFKQFGTSATANPTAESPHTFIQTVAHELGHGVFELDHPWIDFGAVSEKTTSWLMDYNAGLDIPFMHLQKISHPKFGVYIFQDSEQGELNETELDFVKFLYKIKNANKDNTKFTLNPLKDPIAGFLRERVFVAGKIFPKLIIGYNYTNGIEVEAQNIELKSTNNGQIYIGIGNTVNIYITKDVLGNSYANELYSFLTNDRLFDKFNKGEFKDYNTYKLILGKSAKPENKIDGLDGCWLKKDRESEPKTQTWKNAMDYILKNKSTGILAPFAQIADFYDYVKDRCNQKGHQVKWFKGAAKLVHALAEDKLRIGGGLEGGSNLISNDVELILNELNLGICDFAIGKFNSLLYGQYANTPLIGENAYLFDKSFIEEEQGTIAPPIYNKTPQSTIDKFQNMADKDAEGSHGFGAWLFSDVTPAFDDFEPAALVTDSLFRIDLPLLMLHLNRHHPKANSFKNHLNPDGTLNEAYKSKIRDYEVN